MALVIDEQNASSVQKTLEALGEEVFRIGHILPHQDGDRVVLL
jgi:phosphoribosylaminoimidazole (AIR) synthetase